MWVFRVVLGRSQFVTIGRTPKWPTQQALEPHIPLKMVREIVRARITTTTSPWGWKCTVAAQQGESNKADTFPPSPSEGLKGVRFCFFLDSCASSTAWMFSHTQQHKRKQTFWGRKILKGWRGCCFFSSFCGMEILLRFFCIYLGKEVCNCLGATVYEVWKMWDNKYRVKWYDMLDERRTQQ